MAVFARAPIAGQAKTRLIPLLGPGGAAGLQAALISDTLRKVAGLKGRVQPYLFLAGDSIAFRRSVVPLSRDRLAPAPARAEPALSGAEACPRDSRRDARTTPSWAPACLGEFRIIGQQGKDLGERLENAFRRLLLHYPSCVVIGTDSLLIPARVLRQSLRELQTCESVLGPCPDGGYYLIALRRLADPKMLGGILRAVRWSTPFAFRDTLRNLLRLGLSCSVLEGYADVDLPRDFQRLKKNLSRNRTARRLAPATWSFVKGNSLLPGDVVGPNDVRPRRATGARARAERRSALRSRSASNSRRGQSTRHPTLRPHRRKPPPAQG